MITLTSKKGLKIETERHALIPNLLPESSKESRPYVILKPIIVFTARIHGAETPSSMFVEAIIEFLINGQDS